jgi:hypothetical protein
MEDLALSQYEHTIATEVIAPEDIRVSFNGMQYHLQSIPPIFESHGDTYNEEL